MQMEKDINDVLQTRRLTYFGHVTRMEKDRYPNILMHGYTVHTWTTTYRETKEKVAQLLVMCCKCLLNY